MERIERKKPDIGSAFFLFGETKSITLIDEERNQRWFVKTGGGSFRINEFKVLLFLFFHMNNNGWYPAFYK